VTDKEQHWADNDNTPDDFPEVLCIGGPYDGITVRTETNNAPMLASVAGSKGGFIAYKVHLYDVRNGVATWLAYLYDEMPDHMGGYQKVFQPGFDSNTNMHSLSKLLSPERRAELGMQPV